MGRIRLRSYLLFFAEAIFRVAAFFDELGERGDDFGFVFAIGDAMPDGSGGEDFARGLAALNELTDQGRDEVFAVHEVVLVGIKERREVLLELIDDVEGEGEHVHRDEGIARDLLHLFFAI